MTETPTPDEQQPETETPAQTEDELQEKQAPAPDDGDDSGDAEPQVGRRPDFVAEDEQTTETHTHTTRREEGS